LRSVTYRQVSSVKGARLTPCVWGISLMYKLYSVGWQDGTLWHPCLHIPWRRHFAFY
jgi:hypothetical protein